MEKKGLGGDRQSLESAYAGVKPLRKRSVVPKDGPRGAADQTRPRRSVTTLRFDVTHDEDGRAQGLRSGSPIEALRSLRNGRANSEAELDLHGLRADQASKEVVAFLRTARARGKRIVSIIHGKGIHSDNGLGVLGDRVVQVLTEGPSASDVLAFVPAASAKGGAGVLLVRLADP